MITESQYSNSLQRYGKERTDAIFNAEKSLGQDYLYKMCQFVYDGHIDLLDVISLFRRVRAMSSNLQLGNIDQMSYSQLCEAVGGVSAEDYIEIPNVVYQSEDGMVTIGKLNNRMEAESLNVTSSWRIFRENDPRDSFNESSENSVFYVIRNLYFPISSELRFVVCQVYSNNAHVPCSAKAEIIIQ